MSRTERKSSPVLLVAGEGGHRLQATRFAALLQDIHALEVVLVTERSMSTVASQMRVIYRRNLSMPSKYRSVRNVTKTLWALLAEFLSAPALLISMRPAGVVAFGPLFCLPLAVWARLLGLRVVYVETWSRFYRLSLTGRALRLIAHRFYFQNESLSRVCPGGIYSGRL